MKKLLSIFLTEHGSLYKRLMLPVLIGVLGVIFIFHYKTKTNYNENYKKYPNTNNYQKILLRSESSNVTLYKKKNRWYIEKYSYEANNILVKKMLYNLDKMPMSQNMFIDASELESMGLSADFPKKDTLCITLVKEDGSEKNVVFGDFVKPKFSDRAEKKYVFGGSQYDHRSVKVSENNNTKTFVTPAAFSFMESYPEYWLPDLVVPYASNLLSVEIISSAEKKTHNYERSSVISFFVDEEERKCSHDFSLLLHGLLAPGLVRLYDIKELSNLNMESPEEVKLKAVTSKGVVYEIHIIKKIEFDPPKRSSKKREYVLGFAGDDEKETEFALAQFKLDLVKSNEGVSSELVKEIEEFNKANNGKAFVVGISNLNKIINL